MGSGPTYVTYDIDFVDPTFAPGTDAGGGRAEFPAGAAGGAGLAGAGCGGGDLVEVSPPFDASGGTAWLGISLDKFEMLCVMAERIAGR